MIVLDTNVVSELLRPRPDAGVLAWFDNQQPDQLWLTAVIAAELIPLSQELPFADSLSSLLPRARR